MTATVTIHDRFSEIDEARWDRALARAQTSAVFSTLTWQRCWWDVFGRGRLLIVVHDSDDATTIAPLFIDGDMAFFVGSGGSDYLDFVGHVDDDALASVLDAVIAAVPDLLGFRFYHVPDESSTGSTLARAAVRLGWSSIDEGELAAPYLDATDPSAWDAAVHKKSARRAENNLRSCGTLDIEHLRTALDVIPHLDAFFKQHIERWRGTDSPSLFEDPRWRHFYTHLASTQPEWLRFSRVTLDGTAIASHFGFLHHGRFLWYKPTFDIRLARSSPGEVLIHHLLQYARQEGAHEFDMGLGDEPFKSRFTNAVRTVRTWGVYPNHGN